jgi:hypothetical protein
LCRTKCLKTEGRKDPLHDIDKPLTRWYHLSRPKYSNIGGWDDFVHDIHKPLTKWYHYHLCRRNNGGSEGFLHDIHEPLTELHPCRQRWKGLLDDIHKPLTKWHLCRQRWDGLLDDIHKPLTKWYHLCRQKHFNISGWEDFLDDIHKPLTMFFLAIVFWASVPTLCLFDHDNCTAGWVGILQKVLLATLPVTSVILAKSLLIQTIITNSAIELLRTRQEVEKRFKALTLLMELIEPNRKESIWTTLGIPGKDDSFHFSKYRDNYRVKFKEIATPQQEVIARRIKSQLTTEEIFEIFDEDDNGHINLDELMIAAYEIYLGRRDVEKGISGIKNAAVSIDRTLSGIILIAMALIYSMWFFTILFLITIEC